MTMKLLIAIIIFLEIKARKRLEERNFEESTELSRRRVEYF